MLSPTGCLIGLLLAGTRTPLAPAGASPIPESQPASISLASLLEDDSTSPTTQTVSEPPGQWLSRHRFFIEVGALSSYPCLHEGHRLARKFLDRPFGLIPGYASPREYYDLRRQGTLFSISATLGYSVNDWLDLTFEGGGWASQMTARSSPLSITDLDTRFRYSSFFLQAGMRVYPFKRPTLDENASCAECLGQIRPFLYHSLGITQSSSINTGALSPRGLPELVRVRLNLSDCIATYKLGAGVEMPVTQQISLILIGTYGFYFQRPNEYDGFAINMAIRLRL